MKKFAVAVLLLTLLGCSSRLAYNNMDWLVHWYLDDYIELNRAQETVFDAHFAEWMQWHRHQELPRYIEQLQRIRQKVKDNQVSPSMIAEEILQAGQHWQRLLNQLVPDMAEMAGELDDDQVAHLFVALEQNNQEKEEEIQAYQNRPRTGQIEQEQEKMEDFLDRLTGDVTEVQQQIIARYAPEWIDTRSEWLAYRRRIQQAAHEVLLQRGSSVDFTAELTAVMANPDQYRSEIYLEAREANKSLSSQLVAELFATLTEDQKNTLLEQIDDTIGELQSIQQDG